jgi:anti-sigma factor RsiW
MTPRRWLPWRTRPADHPPGGLACVELVELVTEYLDGALDERGRAAFEVHIAGCESCSAYVEQMRITVRLAGHIEPDELDPEVERELLDAFRAWKAGGA